MSIILKSGDSPALAHVTDAGALRVAASAAEADAGYTRLLDAAGRPLAGTENGALTTSADLLVMYEQVDGSTVNSNVWATTTSGMTVAQAGGFITLNSGAVTTAASYATLSSIKHVPLYGPLPVKITLNLATPGLPQPGAVMEAGLGAVAAGTAPTDGVFVRWDSAGFTAVVSCGGVEATSGPLTPPAQFDVTLLEIVIVEDLAQFWIDDVLAAEVDAPSGKPFPTAAGRLPVFLRVYTASSPPTVAPVLYLGQMVVTQQATAQFKAWEDVLAGQGRGAYQSPVAGFGQTANHANSTSPTSATLSNSAASYATLGGRFQFAAPAAATTDYCLFAWQVPAGYQLFVGEVTVSAANLGAAVGAVPTVLDWSVGVNSSGQSLATADGPGTWSVRRVPIGMQGFPALTAAGVVAADLRRTFDVPLVVDSGRYLHVIVQVPVGAATASQVIRGDVMLNGYFE